ncbi:MAG: hypothetical protein IKQ46_10485 [Bacteroidales bacterium]|nr:hypothetical protein [Bacteroidales bacterium]
MNYKILASGSSGNAILLNNGILLDCGVPFKYIEEYLSEIKAIFISHEHKDHINTQTLKKIHELRPVVRFMVGFWLKEHLLLSGIKSSKIDILKHNKIYNYGLFKIQPFILMHDVKNYGIKIYDTKAKEKIIYAVDTNKIDHIEAVNFDLYLIEGNYDEEKLERNIKSDIERGIYSYGVRVKDTHLSIQQAGEWLLDNVGNNSTYELIHQSKNNL